MIYIKKVSIFRNLYLSFFHFSIFLSPLFPVSLSLSPCLCAVGFAVSFLTSLATSQPKIVPKTFIYMLEFFNPIPSLGIEFHYRGKILGEKIGKVTVLFTQPRFYFPANSTNNTYRIGGLKFLATERFNADPSQTIIIQTSW